MKSLDELQYEIHFHLAFLKHIVSTYGEVKATRADNYDPEIHLNDFVFFCVTKATRSTEAMDVLITQGFAEDAMTITRSIYECYLHLAFIQRNEHRIDDLLAYKIFAYAKPEHHPKTKKGNPIYRKIIDPETDETRELGISLIQLSKDTGIDLDATLHTSFYSLLSEFAHVHMITGSSYWSRDETHYDYSINNHNIYQAVIWSLYCSWLVVTSISTLRHVSTEARKAADEIINGTALLLIEVIEEIGFDVGIQHMKDLLLDRLRDRSG